MAGPLIPRIYVAAFFSPAIWMSSWTATRTFALNFNQVGRNGEVVAAALTSCRVSRLQQRGLGVAAEFTPNVRPCRRIARSTKLPYIQEIGSATRP